MHPLKKTSTQTDKGVMAEETTQAIQDPTSTNDVSAGMNAPIEVATVASQAQATPSEAASTDQAVAVAAPETSSDQDASAPPKEPEANQAPDAIQPYIDKALETIQHEVDNEALGKFLRAHIKTFREQWHALSDTAKDAYVHTMTSQLVQRKAAATRIKIYDEFKLPVPSAQTTLFESLRQSQVKPKKRQPVLLMPPNLRPTYSLKK